MAFGLGKMKPDAFDTIVLGAGPAGSGLLAAAAQRGSAQSWLDTGVLWADRGTRMGPGSLPELAIASDTMAKVLLEILCGATNPLSSLRQHPLAQHLATLGESSLPLPVAGEYLGVLGERLAALIERSKRSALWLRQEATAIQRRRDGSFIVQFASGRQAEARQVVLALGGYQDRAFATQAQLMPGCTLERVHPAKLRLSSEVLSTGGPQAVTQDLLQLDVQPRVVVVGGSHSALCAADFILRSPVGRHMAPGSIKVVCRRPPRPFYMSASHALADGFTDFTNLDICPVTGRVFRLAGMRMASRELLRSVLGLGDLPQEKRVEICLLGSAQPAQINAALDEAHMVISCLGYWPRPIDFSDESTPDRMLARGESYDRPRVDERCRVLDSHQRPIAGLYGMGLASGFVPRGATLGGEASFAGQTNGIWLYQHDLGQLLLDQLSSPAVAKVG